MTLAKTRWTVNGQCDVIIIGAGNAALCAAIAAREQGASVLVLEKAPEYFRGGNTYFTGGIIRCAYNGMEDIKFLIPDMTPEEEASVDVGKYTEDDFYSDVMRVTEGLADPELAQILVSQSHPTLLWLQEKGVRFVLAFGRQAFKVEGKYHFWGGLVVEAVGAGKGLSDQQFEVAKRMGAEVRYQTKGVRLLQDRRGKVCGVVAQGPDGFEELSSHTVVLACGGFEANAEMRTRYLGPGWELAKVRGVPYNTGDGINMALAIGASSYGNWSGSHAVQWDYNAPEFGDLSVGDNFQKHSYPWGILVNATGRRFVDEGADFRNYTYAKYGAVVLRQPNNFAYQVFDKKIIPMLRDEYRIKRVSKVSANTLEEFAHKLEGVDPQGFLDEIRKYNAAVKKDVPFNPNIKDGR